MNKPILDETKRGNICGILALGGTYQMAAKYVGCSPNTIRNTALRDALFLHQLEQTQISPEITFLRTMLNAGSEVKHWQAAKWALQHLYPDRYSRKPLTMALDDVKDLVRQLLAAMLKVIPDSKTRVEVRRQVRTISCDAIEKTKRKRDGR